MLLCATRVNRGRCYFTDEALRHNGHCRPANKNCSPGKYINQCKSILIALLIVFAYRFMKDYRRLLTGPAATNNINNRNNVGIRA